ncbi:MAG TPA: hypothetical protein VF244_07885 [Acidimicrobiales bacterium]
MASSLPFSTSASKRPAIHSNEASSEHQVDGSIVAPPLRRALWQARWMASVEVPLEDAPLESVLRFAANTYFGYERHGGVQGLSHLGNAVASAWTDDGRLPGDLPSLRAALFFESRRWHHLGHEADPAAEAYVRVLVAKIRQLSGGSVRADHEGPGMWLRRGINRLRRFR